MLTHISVFNESNIFYFHGLEAFPFPPLDPEHWSATAAEYKGSNLAAKEHPLLLDDA